ncbi:g protein-coupled receptor [Anaeramoeba flamelloides]|uniref:G protein-coupled receptor n=1 Tax=Anaeramoeba flamelloides TaxID=1746091 RepID=A0AAV7YF00_9EUKA|nr:g protein-coupled receptor [Anaeramoeba flamelloides]
MLFPLLTTHSPETIGTFIGAPLSILGAILTFWFSKYVSYKTFPFKHYLTMLSFFDFTMGVILFVPGAKFPAFCKIQPLLVAVTWIPPIWASSFLSCGIWFYVVKNWTLKQVSKRLLPIFTFLMIVIEVFEIYVFHYWGQGEKEYTNWCWVGKNKRLLILTLYSPYWFFVIVCLIFAFMLSKFYIQQPEQDLNTKSKIRRWLLFPVLLLLSAIWTSSKRIRQLVNPNADDLGWLDFCQGFFSPLIGFFDFLLFYIFDPMIRREVIENIKNNNESNKDKIMENLIINSSEDISESSSSESELLI